MFLLDLVLLGVFLLSMLVLAAPPYRLRVRRFASRFVMMQATTTESRADDALDLGVSDWSVSDEGRWSTTCRLWLLLLRQRFGLESVQQAATLDCRENRPRRGQSLAPADLIASPPKYSHIEMQRRLVRICCPHGQSWRFT